MFLFSDQAAHSILSFFNLDVSVWNTNVNTEYWNYFITDGLGAKSSIDLLVGLK